jgi:RNA polymerase sigma factor (sigma-70 family)
MPGKQPARSRDAAMVLFNQHRGIAYATARRAWRCLEPDDAVQTCLWALFKASEYFNESDGTPFPVYATIAVRRTLLQACIKALREQSRATPLSQLADGEADEQALGVAPDDTVQSDARDAVAAGLGALHDRQQALIRARYGLCDESPVSRSELAARWGISTNRIGQIELAALETMRAVLPG